MRAFTLAIAATAAVASAAIVPPELAVIGEPSETLSTVFEPSSGQIVTLHPGQMLNATDTKNAPQPQLAHMDHIVTEGAKYVFMMVDPDINITNPTYVGLHTGVANLSLPNESQNSTFAKYIAPMPNGNSPHNYTLLLFKQPESFNIPSHFDPYFVFNPSNVWNRVNFPLQQFISQTGLGKPIAANWFQEGAVNATITSANNVTASATNASSTPTTTANAAGQIGRPDGLSLALILGLGTIWTRI